MKQSRHPSRQRLRRRPVKLPAVIVAAAALTALASSPAAAQAAGLPALTCSDPESVQGFEAQYYPPQAHLKVVVIPDTGHALALSTTAPVTDAVMIGWALSVVAP